MNELLGLLKGIAPTLATAVAGPLGAAAITAISSKLGVSDSVEEVAKAIAGGHTDPGVNFPWNNYIALIKTHG